MPNQFIQIAAYDNFMLANMTLGLLQDHYINCHLKDEHIVTIDPLLNNAVGGIKLMVAEEQVTRAKDLIIEAERNYLSEKNCPRCKSKGMILDEKINNPTGFLGKLKNIIAYGQESTYSKKYRCKHCGWIFDTLPPDES